MQILKPLKIKVPYAKSRKPEMQVNEHEPPANTPTAIWSLFPGDLKANIKGAVVDCALRRRIPRKFASFLIRVLGLKKAKGYVRTRARIST